MLHDSKENIKVIDILHILCYNILTYHHKTMINLDERYHSYLDGRKKLRIDGIEEKVKSYGWHCDGNDIDSDSYSDSDSGRDGERDCDSASDDCVIITSMEGDERNESAFAMHRCMHRVFVWGKK